MKNAKSLLAVAASMSFVALATTARADEPLPAPFAPTRASLWMPPPAPPAEPRPNNPTLGAWGIATTVFGAGAMTAGLGLLAAEEQTFGVPTLIVGTTATLAGLVMTGVGYSRPSRPQEAGAQAVRPVPVDPVLTEAEWQEQTAKRETRRDVGIGLTVLGVFTGAGAAVLFASADAQGGSGIFDDGAGYYLGGVAAVAATGALLGVGIPFWAANSRDLPRPTVQAELGIGPGSIELRGSF